MMRCGEDGLWVRMRILLADDHALVREALALALERPPLAANVVHAESFRSCVQALVDHGPIDLAIVDLFMPDAPFDVGLNTIATRSPEVPIIAISGSQRSDHVAAAIEAGAVAYVPKTAGVDVFRQAIDAAVKGRRCVLPHPSAQPPNLALYSAGEYQGAPHITPRQREVLQCIVNGNTNKEIARLLNVSPSTVKSHVETLFRVLAASNRTELARKGGSHIHGS